MKVTSELRELANCIPIGSVEDWETFRHRLHDIADELEGRVLMPERMTPEIAFAAENAYFADPKPVPVRSIEFAIWEQVYKAILSAGQP